MCDPITAAMAVTSGAAMLLNKQNTPAPPPPPALPPPPAHDPGATVKIGDNAQATTTSPSTDYAGFTPQRASGKALGGLGRGGLGL